MSSGWMTEWASEWMNECMDVNGCTNKWESEWMNGKTNEEMSEWVKKWYDEQIKELLEKQMSGWVKRWVNTANTAKCTSWNPHLQCLAGPQAGQQHSLPTPRHPAQMLTWMLTVEGDGFVQRLSWSETAQCHTRTWVWISEPMCKKEIRCGDMREPGIPALGRWKEEAPWDLGGSQPSPDKENLSLKVRWWPLSDATWDCALTSTRSSTCTHTKPVCSSCFTHTASQDLVMTFGQEKAIKPFRMGRKL